MNIPQPGSNITVCLPQETVLATVNTIMNDKMLTATIKGLVIMGRGGKGAHDFKTGDIIGAMLERDSLGHYTWHGVDLDVLEKMTKKPKKVRRG